MDMCTLESKPKHACIVFKRRHKQFTKKDGDKHKKRTWPAQNRSHTLRISSETSPYWKEANAHRGRVVGSMVGF